MLEDDVTGITLGELTLLLLLVVLIIFFISSFYSYSAEETSRPEVMRRIEELKTEVRINRELIQKRNKQIAQFSTQAREYKKMLEEQENEIARLNKDNYERNTSARDLRMKLKSQEVKISLLMESAKREGLKSTITPSCIEVELADTYLATITVIGRDSFRVLGQTYTYNDLKTLYAHELEEARKYDCRHSIKVSCARGISAEDYNMGLIKLRRLFYTNIITPK